MHTFSIAIVGCGIAGCQAALKIANEHKGEKVLLIEMGRAPQKRRQQMCGWGGLFPNSDGKLYLNDANSVANLVGTKKAKAAAKYFKNQVSNIIDLSITKDKPLSAKIEKKITEIGFKTKSNNYIQLYPKDIHLLSKYISDIICNNKNIFTSFDNEVLDIKKEKKTFIITSETRQYECKKVLICTGRAGWLWSSKLFKSLGIIENNDYSKFGIRIEGPARLMRDFNKSNCTIYNDDFEIGPLSWSGTIIPEDDVDFVNASYRSNEPRWETDKVSFNLFGNRYFENNGFEQINRLGQLTFILTNERVIKEKISNILTKKSKIAVLKEYDWLPDIINTVSQFIPELISKGYYHIPALLPITPKVKMNENLETEMEGLFVAGESANITGIYSAILTGLVVGDSICK